MEARKIKLLEFIGNGKKTFNIPVYQRNYDWKEEQCRKLFEDIQNIVKSDYEIEHFLGTVVYVSSKAEMNFNEYILIDGQQRITSIMLLLKVLHEKITKEDYKEVIELIKKEFSEIKEHGISERELEKAKNKYESAFTFSLESTTSRMNSIASSYLTYGKIITIDEVKEEIKAVTLEDVKKAAQFLFDENYYSTTIVGNL